MGTRSQGTGMRKPLYSGYCYYCGDKILVSDLAAMESCQANLLICQWYNVADPLTVLESLVLSTFPV